MPSALADAPRRPDVDPVTPPAPAAMPRLLLHGALVGVWTVLAGLGVVAAAVLVAWLGAGAQEPLGDALSVAALGWLLATGTTLSSADATWSLMPLGLTLVTVALAYRGGLWAAEAGHPLTASRAAAILVASAGSAGVLGGLTASLSAVEGIEVDPGEATAFSAVLVAVGTLAGLLSAAPEWRATLVHRLPTWLTSALRPSAAALAVLAAGAVATTTAATVAAFGTVTSLLDQLDPGPAGLFALLLVCLAYLPTAWVWTGAVLVGPGVTIGQVTLSSTSVQTGPLPGFPVLGLTPEAMPSWVAPVGVVIMVLAGAVVGLLTVRLTPQASPRWSVVATAGLSGFVTAAAVAVVTWAASGSMGPGDLAWVGPEPMVVAGLCGAVVTAAAVVTVGVVTWRRSDDEESDFSDPSEAARAAT